MKCIFKRDLRGKEAGRDAIKIQFVLDSSKVLYVFGCNCCNALYADYLVQLRLLKRDSTVNSGVNSRLLLRESHQ